MPDGGVGATGGGEKSEDNDNVVELSTSQRQTVSLRSKVKEIRNL